MGRCCTLLMLSAICVAAAAAPGANAQENGTGMGMTMGGMIDREAARTSMPLPGAVGSRYDAAEEYERGVAALREGDHRAAERGFAHLVQAAPDFAEGYFLLGLARAQQDRLAPARRAFRGALRRDEDHIAARAQLGVMLAKLGEAEEAQEQLDALTARAVACAQACPEAGDLGAAVSAVSAAIAAGPAP